MNNQKVDEDVRWALRGAVNGAVWGAASTAVNGTVGGAVYGAASRAVYETVYWAMGEPSHPALADYLREVSPEAGVE